MSAPLNIAQAADLIDLSIQNIYEKSSEPIVDYTKYFNFRKTEDYIEKDSSLSGLGEADFVDENAALMSDVPVQGYKKTYTQNMVGAVESFTFKMWRYGIKKRDLDNVAKELKASIARKKERLCAERLDNGWSTSYTHNGQAASRVITVTGGDGVAEAIDPGRRKPRRRDRSRSITGDGAHAGSTEANAKARSHPGFLSSGKPGLQLSFVAFNNSR